MMKRKGTTTSSDRFDMVSKKTKRTPWRTPADLKGNIDTSTPETLLQSMLGSTSTEKFFSEHWERQPLLVQRKDPKFYGEVFSLPVVKGVVESNDFTFLLDVNAWTFADGQKQEFVGEKGKVTLESVERLMNEKKASLEFSHPQRYIDDLWNILEKLETYFGCLWDAHAYLTPTARQGSAPHCDDVESFIFQTEGTCEWKLFRPMVELSRDFTQDVNEETLGDPTHVVTLETGDMLYFPRGVIYQCKASGEGHSTHVTLSTYQENSWGDFMSHAVQHAIETALENDVRIRAGLPINFRGYLGTANNMSAYITEDEKEGTPKVETTSLTDDRVVKFKEDIRTCLGHLVDHIDVNKSADAMSAEFMASRLPPYGFCRCDGLDHEHGETEEKMETTEITTTDTTVENTDGTVTETTTVTTKTTTDAVTVAVPKLTLTDQIKFKYPDHIRVAYVNDEDDDDDISDVTSQTDSQLDEDMEEDVSTITSQEEGDKTAEDKTTEVKVDEEDDEDADVTDTEPHIQVLHSLTNDRFTHMGFSIFAKVGRVKFDVSFAKALVALSSNSTDMVTVNDLLMDTEEEKLHLATKLNIEGLLEVKSSA